MRYQNIPHTDLRPSVICLGTGGFGTGLDEATAFDQLDLFVESGGNFIDTARLYGAWVPGGLGRSEQVIGKWMQERGTRANVIVGTKGAHPDMSTMHIGRLSRAEIFSDAHDSLQALRTDVIDLYWLHRDDVSRPVAEIIDTLNDLVTQGKIRYYGCSNWQVERIKEARAYAVQRQFSGFVANQLLWSYAQPNVDKVPDKTLALMDEPTMAFHRETGMAILAYTSQARGYFTKLSQQPDSLPDWVRATYDNPENTQRLQRLEALSRDLSVPISALALAYLTNQNVPTFPIAGSSHREQLLETIAAGDLQLSVDQIRFLEGRA